jgi:hypothetical protein
MVVGAGQCGSEFNQKKMSGQVSPKPAIPIRQVSIRAAQNPEGSDR